MREGASFTEDNDDMRDSLRKAVEDARYDTHVAASDRQTPALSNKEKKAGAAC